MQITMKQQRAHQVSAQEGYELSVLMTESQAEL